jgi:hypothetical protein
MSLPIRGSLSTTTAAAYPKKTFPGSSSRILPPKPMDLGWAWPLPGISFSPIGPLSMSTLSWAKGPALSSPSNKYSSYAPRPGSAYIARLFSLALRLRVSDRFQVEDLVQMMQKMIAIIRRQPVQRIRLRIAGCALPPGRLRGDSRQYMTQMPVEQYP